MKKWLMSSLVATFAWSGLCATDFEIPANEAVRCAELEGSLRVDLPGLMAHPVDLEVSHEQRTQVNVDGKGLALGDVLQFETHAVVNGVKYAAKTADKSTEELHFEMPYSDESPVEAWSDWMNTAVGELLVCEEKDEKIDFTVTEESVQAGLTALLKWTLHGAVARSALPSVLAQVDEEKLANIERMKQDIAACGLGELQLSIAEHEGMCTLHIAWDKPVETKSLVEWAQSGMRLIDDFKHLPDEMLNLYAIGVAEKVCGILFEALFDELPTSEKAIEKLGQELMLVAPFSIGGRLSLDVAVDEENHLVGVTNVDCGFTLLVELEGEKRGFELDLKNKTHN